MAKNAMGAVALMVQTLVRRKKPNKIINTIL